MSNTDRSDSGDKPRALFTAITARHSSRAFSGEPLADVDFAAMSQACSASEDAVRGVRFAIVRAIGDSVFKGYIGSYGKISGSRDVLMMIADSTKTGSEIALGYRGEMLILEATSRDVATCWVSGSFKPGVVRDLAALRPGERIVAVTPLGYRSAPRRSHEQVKKIVSPPKRRPLADLLVSGSPALSTIETWMLRALEVARLAPSAMNRQPWRFRVEDGAIVVLCARGPEFGASRRLDCGIAMAHVELAATAFGLAGEWEYLSGDEVARFRIV